MATAGSQDQELEMVTSMQEQLGQRFDPSIFRIPPGIRQVNRNTFEPQIISIGPYHSGNKVRRFKVMQDHKRVYHNNFLARNHTKGFKDYFVAIKSSIHRARKCYSEEVNMNDDDFVKLLLLDGSFIVELLLILEEGLADRGERPFDHIYDTKWTSGFLIEDLLKMENQVPFFVLRDLYNLSAAPPAGTPSIIDLAYEFAKLVAKHVGGDQVEIKKPSPEEEIQHLLHFCHSCFFAGRVQPGKGDYTFNTMPTAQELTKAGVMIKLKETGAIWQVTFSEGVLEMTSAEFYDTADTIIHNLIALEQCYPTVGGYMTGYSYFLDKLVDTSADVLLLRQQGVVQNGLGSDEKLAQVINRLCHNVGGNLPESITTMFADVNTYCSSRWPTWRAKLVNDYFGNPWAIISLIAAFILLLLTVVQTVFSILSYLHPRS